MAFPTRQGCRPSQHHWWFIKVPSTRQTYKTRVGGSHFRGCELFSNTKAVAQILLATPPAKPVTGTTIFFVLAPYQTLSCPSHTLHTFINKALLLLKKNRGNQGTGEKTEALNNKVTNRGPQSLYGVCIWMTLMVIQLPQILLTLSVAMCSLYLSEKRNKDDQNPFTFPPM